RRAAPHRRGLRRRRKPGARHPPRALRPYGRRQYPLQFQPARRRRPQNLHGRI
ncbi:hypothetical protein HMPREF0789_0064, partial [Staphylococcus epidermidis BCM-HMP0060]